MEAVCFSETSVSTHGVATEENKIDMITTGTDAGLFRLEDCFE
jgi:hypothetical protein